MRVEHMEEMKAAVLMALQKELPYFLMPEGKMPESVELRVFYDHSMATIRVGGKEILQMLEVSRMPETAGRAGDGKEAEERSDKEKADSPFGMPAAGKYKAPVQP